MKKFVYIMTPIFAISLLASCNFNSSNEHIVSFESNGGTHIDLQRVKDGEKAKMPITPTRGNDNFQGWFIDDSSFTTEYTFNEPVTTDLVLFAKWVPNLYSISFMNGEEKVGEIEDIPEGALVTEELPPSPIKEDYFFKGWCKDEDGKRPFDFETTRIYQNYVLYAGWTEYFNVSAIGDNIKYYLDRQLKHEIRAGSENKARIEDGYFTFYMYCENTTNESGYIPPKTLNITSKDQTIENYHITKINNELAEVTIPKENIDGSDITIHGDAQLVDYYQVQCPYTVGLKPINDSYYLYDEDVVIKFEALDSEMKVNGELLTGENILINITGGEELEDWDTFTNLKKVNPDLFNFEHTGNDEYVLTINHGAIKKEDDVSLIKVAARIKDNVLDYLTWEKISEMSSKGIGAYLFYVGETKRIEINEKAYYTRILDFNREKDKNGNPMPSITFDFTGMLGTEASDWDNNLDYAKSYINTQLQPNGSFYKLIPADLMAVIKETTKDYRKGTSAGNFSDATIVTKLFLPLNNEINSDSEEHYAFYKDKNSRKKNDTYYTRTPDESVNMRYLVVDTNGNFQGNAHVSSKKGISPFFCI